MKEFARQKVLVVGGAGFVGSNLLKQLLQGGPRQLIVVDNLLSAERGNLPDDRRVTFIEGSINRQDILRGLPEDLDYVFHLACFHGNQNSIHDPLADHENNALPTLRLLERVKGLKKLKKFVYSGAGCTVAAKTFAQAHATAEEAPVSLYLDSPYQLSKIFGEFYCNYYWAQHGVPAVKARFQNVYGPGEILGAGQWRGTPATVWRNVIPSFVYRAIKKMPLTVDNGGVASRDFIHVEDICAGLMLCAARGQPGEAYNLASGVETTIFELARQVNTLADNPLPIELAPKRSWDRSGKRFGCTRKAKDGLGFAARIELVEGLRRTIEWTKANLPVIESCMARHQQRMAA